MNDPQIINSKKKKTVLLGLGTNLGNKYNNILSAITKISSNSKITIIACSSIYKSTAYGFKGGDFYNITLALTCSLSPMDLLDFTQQIEISTGRQENKEGVRNQLYKSRIMDIDILFYGNITYKTTRLIIPHPEINNRLFVTKPLEDLDFLLPSMRINKQETNTALLRSQEVSKLVQASSRLQAKLKDLRLLN